MSINDKQMLKILFIITGLSLLLGGCAAPPRQELQAARKAVAEAYAAGARQLAPAEYETASSALRDGEDLMRRGEYEKAGKALPFATSHAKRALDRAREEQARIGEERRLQEERERAEAAAKLLPPPPPPAKAVEKTPQPTPRPKPAPLPPPLHYTVGNGETLWTIAARKEIYVDALLWPLIYKANRDQIKDPRQIYPGQVLSIPREASEAEREEARETARHSDIFPVELLMESPPYPTP